MPIKVLYIATGGTYGADQSLMMLLNELEEQISPYVIMPHKLGLQDFLTKKNIPYTKIKMRQCSVPKITSFKSFIFFPIKLFMAIRYNFFISSKLKKIVCDFQPDIIHSNVGVFRIGHKLSLKYGIPHIWYLREYQDKDMGRWILGGRKRLIALLKQGNNYPIPITKGIADYFDVPYKNIVYNGIFRKNQLTFNPQKEKFFLFAGNVYKEKGVTTLVESFCRFALHNNTFKLYIAGGYSNSYKHELMRIIEKYKIDTKQILFLGKITKEEVMQFMSVATALIVPSYYEAFGRVVAEAMCSGCLVICNNTHGLKEQLDNGMEITGEEIGLRYNALPEDLKNRMQEVADKGIAHYFPVIHRSQYVINKLYTCEEYGKSIDKIYCKILNI